MASFVSKMKSVASGPPPLENNPILDHFDLGAERCSAGPGLIWRVFDGRRKDDEKECSLFFFDKRMADKLFYKQKNKETMLDRIKYSVIMMDKMRHPRMLQIIHSLEEGNHTLAFASESILASLQNILSWDECSPTPPGCNKPVMPDPISLAPPSAVFPPQNPPQPPPFAKKYQFLDIEIRFGLLQIIEALHYLHYTIKQIHRNVCPQVIVVTKRGSWKLLGLEFTEDIPGLDPTDQIVVPIWSVKVAKICQPNLDYLAPEVQLNGRCNILSDMFSLGLIICAIYNQGRPLIQANNNAILYSRQIENLEHQVKQVLSRIPPGLIEAVPRLLSRDPNPRPTTQLLPLIKFFQCQGEPAIQAMQFLDVISFKDNCQKNNFYRGALIEALPLIPKKLRWQNVWPVLNTDTKNINVLPSVLVPIMWMTNEATQDEFDTFVLPALIKLMITRQSLLAVIVFLENMHLVMKKSTKADFNRNCLILLYTAMDDDHNLVQTSSLICAQNLSDFIPDNELHNIVLGKVKLLLEQNQGDVKVISLTLGFYEKVLIRLERNHILEAVVPTLLCMKLTDPDIITRVVKLYKSMLEERKFALPTNVMATKMIPSLAPQTVNPALSVQQFGTLMQILYDMMNNIDKNQRVKLKPNNPAAPGQETRPFRNQPPIDNANPPPFSIPNLRVEHKKTSSADEMARKNSVTAPPTTSTANTSGIGGFKGFGQWLFGSNNSTNNDSNFLRVASVFPNRRLSDNTLITPKIKIAPSCSSSPGGTPGGAAGLPARRHSSIGPQERRGSAVNLSPPTVHHRGRGGSGSSLSVPSKSHCVGGSAPNSSSSVPFLLTSSMQSIRSRRPSACQSGSQGSGLLQQISSGMHQLFSGRT